MAADELRMVWLALRSAVERDSGAPSGGTRAAADPHAAVANVDVLDALRAIDRLCAAVARLVLPLLRLAAAPGVGHVLEHVGDWHAQLTGRHPRVAEQIERYVTAMLDQGRAAVGLSTGDRPVLVLCPDHRADQPTYLVLEGDVGTLHPATMAGRRPPPGRETVSWRHNEAAHCPVCGKRWAGAAQLAVLRKRLQFEADHERRAAATTVPVVVDGVDPAVTAAAGRYAALAARERAAATRLRAAAASAVAHRVVRDAAGASWHVYERRNLRAAAAKADHRADRYEQLAERLRLRGTS